MLILKTIRKNKGISQQKLADAVSVSRSTVAMWETGASQPDNNMLITLSKYLNVSVDTLLDNTDTVIEPIEPFPTEPAERAVIEKLRSQPPDKREAFETLLN